MNFENSKNAIHNAVVKLNFDNSDGLAKINYLITCVLIYDFALTMEKNDDSYSGQINLIANEYGKTYKNVVENLKNTYVSYSVIVALLKNLNLSSYLEMTQETANRIIQLYQDKTKIVLFSENEYSQYMYNIDGLNMLENDRLRQIHFKIMVPIFKYYKDNYGITAGDFEVFSINEVATNIGKVIIFRISGISNSQIISDLVSNIGIANYLYEIGTYYDYIQITIK